MLPETKGDTLSVENLGPITKADVSFGDLTVLVGPQASGKSIFLQTLKLQLDIFTIAWRLGLHGFTWEKTDPESFLELYFGEGLGGLLSDRTKVHWNAKPISVADLMSRGAVREGSPYSAVFYIPAQRVLAMQNGWPRPFDSFSPGDPYVLKSFSEYMRVLMETNSARSGKEFFPRHSGLTAETSELLARSVFGDFALKLDRRGPQRRLVLQNGDQPPLPFMVWSAGQREFSPLLLGLSDLLSEDVRRHDLNSWVVLEEPEMGLHPRAITAVLFTVLELLARNYRVCISTHSPHVLDLVWALRVLIENKAPPEVVLKIFDVAPSSESTAIAASTLQKNLKVYSFNRDGRPVTDISRLDPESTSQEEITWGGLTEFTSRTADVVADFIASQKSEQ